MPVLPEFGIRNPDDLARFEAAMTLAERLPERSILDVFIGAAARQPERTALTQLMTGAPDEQPRRVAYRELLGLGPDCRNNWPSRAMSRVRSASPRKPRLWPCASTCHSKRSMPSGPKSCCVA